MNLTFFSDRQTNKKTEIILHYKVGYDVYMLYSSVWVENKTGHVL